MTTQKDPAATPEETRPASASSYVPPAIVWEQEFVGLAALSDPCATQQPPPGYCQGNALYDPGTGN